MSAAWSPAWLAALLALLLVGCSGAGAPRGQARGGKDAAAVYVQLGSDYMRKGQYDVALKHLQRAVEMNPRSAQAHSMLGILYGRIGQPQKAAPHHRRAAELAPEDGGTLNNLASFLCSQGQYQEADTVFRRALADPFYGTPATAAANAGLCALEGGANDRAEEYFLAALQRDPKQVAVFVPLAKALHRRGEHLRARAYVQRADDAGLESAELLALAIDVEQALNNERAASEYRTRLLTRYAQSAEARAVDSANGSR